MKNLIRLFSSLLVNLDRASLAFETKVEDKWNNLLSRFFAAKVSYVICLIMVLTLCALVVSLSKTLKNFPNHQQK